MQHTRRRSADIGSARSRRQPYRGLSVPLATAVVATPSSAPAFASLSQQERSYLLTWRRLAVAEGVDAVEDLATRPWPCVVADTIIGIYRFGEETAAWLIIGQDGNWVAARCSDGTISEPLNSLAGALSKVYPLEDFA